MILTESQYKKLLEALNLKSPFANLSVGKIIVVTAKNANDGKPFDFKFKVIEDLGDSWKLESLTQNSTFTGFEWVIKKNEDVSDADIKSKNISKKSKKETNYTLKRVTAMDLDDASADDDEDEAPVDGEDVEHPEEGEIQRLKALMKEEEGFFFETDNVDKIFFNVIEKTDDYAVIQLMKTEDSDYKDDIKKRFKLKFNNETIEESDEGNKFINLTNVDDNSEDRLVNVTDYNVTEWLDKPEIYDEDEDEEDELTSDELFNLINSDPNLKKFFVDRPKLLGFIEGADYKGLSRVYQILNNKGFVSDNEKSSKITTNFSNNRFVEFKYLEDTILGTKPSSSEPKLELRKGSDIRAKIQKVKEKTYFSYQHKINDQKRINVKILLTDEVSNGVFNVQVYTDSHLEKKTKIKVIKYNII
jgi:hypothetical protein